MRKAFTFLELVFVIVIIGILAKFGTNILATTYTSYVASTNNNKILTDVQLTMKQIRNRLSYRLRDSIIAGGAAIPLVNAPAGAIVFEWIGYDIDGWLGGGFTTNPTWSGFVDVDNLAAIAATNFLSSPATNLDNTNTVIQAVRPNGSGTTIANAAIFFTGQNSDVTRDYGWYGAALVTQVNVAAHRITNGVPATRLISNAGTFTGADVYENYRLSWTAYALQMLPNANGSNDLFLTYDYRPWEGQNLNAGTRILLLENVTSFHLRSRGDVIQAHLCVTEQNALAAAAGGYSVCQETLIF